MLDSTGSTIFKFFEWLINAAIAVVIFLLAAELITKYTGAQRWGVGVVLCVVGLVLYFVSVLLTRSYTIKQTFELGNDLMKTGTMIVPGWVSFMSLVGISALAASEVLIIIYVFA